MKMQNRKGSTLVMTLLIFAVLMIFGTVTLSLMVNENKMSVNHRNKTQAYYIARSGAVATEAAIWRMDILDKLIEKLEKEPLNSQFDGMDLEDGKEKVEVEISLEEDSGNKSIIIKSKASIGETEETVTKSVAVKSGEFVSIDKNFIVLSDSSDKRGGYKNKDYELTDGNSISNIFKTNTKFIPDGKGEYVPYIFENIEVNLDDSITEIPDNMVFGNNGVTTNYAFNNLDITKNITVRGKVNIYVKGKVTIKSDPDSSNINKDNLNIYIIDTEKNELKDEVQRFTYIDDKKNNSSFKSNIYIESGKANIKLHGGNLDSNIISNGSEIYLHTQTGNTEGINGNIYAPNAIVRMDIQSLSLNGFIVSKYLQIYHQNGQKLLEKDKDLVLSKDINQNQELDKDGKLKMEPGFFK